MSTIADRYRAVILRAVFGSYANEGKVSDLHRLNQMCEHLAQCEQAQEALRAKGYGGAGMSFVEVVRCVPENVRQILKGIFEKPSQGDGLRYSPAEIARFYDIPLSSEQDEGS